MGKKAPKAPKPVDPTVVANAQSQANQQSAAYQQQLNMVNSSGPLVNSSWSADPNAPGGYRQTSALTKPMQQLADSYRTSAMGNGQAVSDAMYSQATSRLDPQWAMGDEQIRTQLANQGLTPGGEAYDRAYQNFLRSKNDAYNQANWSSIQAGEEASQGRGQLLQGLYSLAGAQTPQYSPVGVAPTDVTGAYGLNAQMQQNAYNARMQNYSSGLGGLFSLGSAAIMATNPLAGLGLGATRGLTGGAGHSNPAYGMLR